MQDDRLDILLGELPCEHARPDFTAGVLSRLERPPRRTAGAALVVAVTAVALAFVLNLPRPHEVAAPAGSAAKLSAAAATARARDTSRPLAPANLARDSGSSDEERAQNRRLLHELSNEGAALENELHELRQAQGRQVIYLGGDEDVDMVIDLHRVPTARTAGHRKSTL